MKNLFKTLMPYKWTALLVLLLMAGQAFCEMNLPMYTQALIDTGIQNRGIEHIVPEAITVSEFETASAGMSADEQAVCSSLLDDAAALIDSYRSQAKVEVKKIVSCRMAFSPGRAGTPRAGLPAGAFGWKEEQAPEATPGTW